MADARRYRLVLLLVLLALGLSACGPKQGGQAARAFDAARALVTQGRYGEAVSALTAFLNKHPGHADTSRAQFFIGKAHLGQDDLVEARSAFELVWQQYPGTLEAHKSVYKLATIDLWEDKRDAAVTGFKRLADNPNGPLAPEAAAMLRYLETEAGGGG